MQQVKEKAPVKSCNSDEGINPNSKKGMILSNSLTQADTITIEGDAWNLTVSQIKQLADHFKVSPSEFYQQCIPQDSQTTTEIKFEKPTITEIAFCEQFTEFTLRINYCKETKVYFNNQWRFFGGISVTPALKEILINIFVGATEHDLDKLKADVENIRKGYWNSIPWQKNVSPKDGYEFFKVTLGDTQRPTGDRITECTEPNCIEYGGHHLTDALDPTDTPIHRGEVIGGDDYYLQLISGTPGIWTIETEIFRELTVTQAASYASDLMWQAAEAKKLNNVMGDKTSETKGVMPVAPQV
ncbi:hypothetical protein M2116_000798 [Aurantimicrobium minutum]|uniref:hypothetical protein n=1 Tax=Aurantimicrobium minutum TaxID=708131 RepID=UPI002406C9AB|nr:hypothetical protein [Aurantimicrobium minutum]MDF9809848.1 hypothetical protein [Aurantimicrobium minutum]